MKNEDYFELPSDRTVDSTDNNEYTEGDRDETLWDEELIDKDIPIADEIDDAINEDGEADRPIYNESGL